METEFNSVLDSIEIHALDPVSPSRKRSVPIPALYGRRESFDFCLRAARLWY